MRKTLLITDMDNTLFDWLGAWHRRLEGVLTALKSSTGLTDAELILRIREHNTKHRSSEASGLMYELMGAEAAGQVLKHLDATARPELYPSVSRTLSKLDDLGVRVACVTESRMASAIQRAQILGLDHLLDSLFTPEPLDGEGRLSPALGRMSVRTFPMPLLKPDPELLRYILRELGVEAAAALYIGDSRFKDGLMAEGAGVAFAWARYGAGEHRPEYEALRSVSHWSDQDIERDRVSAKTEPVYNFCLGEKFEEILLALHSVP
jgi:FMN phosphatase YigB (HAD superfamily)